jgi:hypothetical protein
MSRFERVEQYKNRALAASAVLMSSIALGACGGYDTSEDDTGTSKIPECPSGYASGSTSVDSQKLNKELAKATHQLNERLPSYGAPGSKFTFIPRYAQDKSEYAHNIVEAGLQVFHTKSNGGGASPVFVTTGETLLDDTSEQLCSVDGELYPSPRVASAMQALESAGVEIGPTSLAKR